jgi:hypothetical protein
MISTSTVFFFAIKVYCTGTVTTEKTAYNSKFALCGQTFKFEKLYLRFMFVVADNFVFQNPAHRKLAKRYCEKCATKEITLRNI